MTNNALQVLRETVPVSEKTHSDFRQQDLTAFQAFGLTPSMFRAVSERAGMETSVFFSCVDVASSDVAKTPAVLVQKTEYGHEPVREHDLSGVLDDPNTVETNWETMKIAAAGLAIYREAFFGHVGEGEDLELFAIHPTQVITNTAFQYGQVYDLMKPSAYELHRLRRFGLREDSDRIAHIRLFPSASGTAYSSLQTGRVAIGIRRRIDEYMSNLFEKNGFQPGFITQPWKEGVERLTDDQFKGLQQQIRNDFIRMTNQGLPFLLEMGLEWHPAAMNAKDSEVDSNRKAVEIDVHRHFRMPPHKTGSFENVKYENMTAMERVYVNDTLVPMFCALEQGLTRALIPKADRRKGIMIRFNREEAYATDPEAQSKILAQRMMDGIYDLDEGRARAGIRPLGEDQGGKVRRIPGNSATIVNGEVRYPKKPTKESEDGNSDD